MSTFNGRSWAEAVEILRSARPVKKTDNGKGKPYVDITQFFSYMDKVFDGLYSYDMSEPYILTADKSGQQAVNVKVNLYIFDDDGNRRVSFAGAGALPLYYNKSGECTNLQQAYSNAALSAFKDACKGLGIFGYRRVYDMASNTTPKPVDKGSSGGERSTLVFHTEGKMYEAMRDKEDRPVWKVGGNVDNKPAELIFYPSHYSKDSEKFNELHGRCEEGKKLAIRVEAKPCNDRDGKAQYVFFGYAS